MAGFVPWYNDEHRHSGIRFVTPGERHRGEDTAVLQQRKAVYNDFVGLGVSMINPWEIE